MRKSFLLVLVAIIIGIHAQSSTTLSVKGNDISVGADGSVWVIGNTNVTGGYNVYKRASGATAFKPVSGAGGIRVAAAPDGTAWVVTDKNAILHYSNGKWQTMPGTATDIAVGGDGSVWIVGTKSVTGGYAISKWNAAKKNWQTVTGGATSIAVDSTGEAWILNNKGLPFYWDGKKWVSGGTDKGVDIRAGEGVYLLSTKKVTGGYQVLEAEGPFWAALNDDGNYIGAIALADDMDNNLYWVNNKHQVLYLPYSR